MDKFDQLREHINDLTNDDSDGRRRIEILTLLAAIEDTMTDTLNNLDGIYHDTFDNLIANKVEHARGQARSAAAEARHWLGIEQ